jgi:hypothetical protein
MATDTQVLVVARYLARLGTEVERRVAVRACFSSLSFVLALGPRYLPTTRLTTMAAMPASTALAIGDDRMSVIGLADACC